MTLASGTKLGPYEILAPLGAGGMGEVWKAKDARLDRFVAIKVLPEHLVANADALARFEREAKAVAALNHPNITALHDIGREGATAFAVMELLEGESLRSRLAQGPLLPRKAVDLAIQMAHGLAAAHEKGLIHRDLKPENLWITKDERLKILDFGLAKQGSPLAPGPGSNSLLPTEALASPRAGLTQEGMILGTVGYMSPEQVRGEAVDARSDLFSFGVVLYEMLTGKKAFARDTTADTLAAILKEDPPDLEAASGRPVPAGLQRLLGHCLEKNPALRFASAHDLAFAVESALSTSSSSQVPFTAPFAPANRRTTWRWAAVVAGLVAGAALLGWSLRGGEAKPTFKRLTFGKGTVDRARFLPGSQEVVYSARWNGAVPEVFSVNPLALEPRSLGITGGSILAVSPTGELALKMNPRLWAGFELGQLARVTPGGGVRVVQTGIFESEWMADGRELAVVLTTPLSAGGKAATSQQVVLEFPAGHPVASEAIFTWSIRLSPRGDRLACFEQPSYRQGDGRIVLVDRQGNRKVLAELKGFTGLAWGPGGDEVWFSEFRDGASSLWALAPSGRRRLLVRQAGLLELLDVGRDGRALASLGLVVKGAMGMSAPDFREKDLSWNEATTAFDISPDGKRLLLGSGSVWTSVEERRYLYLRGSDGALPTRLGEAASAFFMADGQHVMTTQRDGENTPTLSVTPLGPGPTRSWPVEELKITMGAEPLPDGRRAVIPYVGSKATTYQLLDLETGSRTPLPTDGMSGTAGAQAVSPDGAWILLRERGGDLLDAPYVLVSTRGEPVRKVKGVEPGEVPMRWTADGTGAYFFNRDGFPTRIVRIELATGKRAVVREITPANPGGLPGIRSFAMTPDARHLAYNYVRKLSDLYLIEGLK